MVVVLERTLPCHFWGAKMPIESTVRANSIIDVVLNMFFEGVIDKIQEISI
jgi:hypothetical protein